MSIEEKTLDPRAVAHDFALVSNGCVHTWLLDDQGLDAAATESVVMRAANIVIELWRPDAWELEMTSYVDGYRHDELSEMLDPIAIERGDAAAGLDAVHSAQDEFRREQTRDQPWTLVRLAGTGHGWLRVALPVGTTPPEHLVVWTVDGWYPIPGTVERAPDLHGYPTVWYRPDEHHSGYQLTFDVAYPGRVRLITILGINLLDTSLDPRPASALTMSGIDLGKWRCAQQAMTNGCLEALRRAGWRA